MDAEKIPESENNAQSDPNIDLPIPIKKSNEDSVPQVVVGGQSLEEIAKQVSVTEPSLSLQNHQPQAGIPQSINGAKVPRANANKESYKRILFICLIFILITALVAALLIVVSKKSNKKTYGNSLSSSKTVIPSGFKTITYNNGIGSSFQLLFYSNYSITDGISAKQLVSNVAKNGLYPLQLSIAAASDSNSIDSQLIKDEINCTFSDAPTNTNDTIRIKNTATGNTINMCAIEETDSSTSIDLYVGVLKSGNNYFAISIYQNEVGSTTLTSNLQAYNSDIKTIVASIKVISSTGSSSNQTNNAPSASVESSNVFTTSGLLEPSDINHNECTGLYSPPYTLWNNNAVSDGATCTDAQNVLAGATTNVNGGDYSADGYKCTSDKNGVGYKNAARWPLEITGTFYSYSCSNGNKQVAFNWQVSQ